MSAVRTRVVSSVTPSEATELITTVLLKDDCHLWAAFSLEGDLILVENPTGIGFVGSQEQLKAMAGGILIALEAHIASQTDTSRRCTSPDGKKEHGTTEPETVRPE